MLNCFQRVAKAWSGMGLIGSASFWVGFWLGLSFAAAVVLQPAHARTVAGGVCRAGTARGEPGQEVPGRRLARTFQGSGHLDANPPEGPPK